jgi:prepilin peptidase CpaA
VKKLSFGIPTTSFAPRDLLMATDSPALAAPVSVPQSHDALGMDRAFLIQLARMPLYAVLWIAAAFMAHHIWAAISPTGLNAAPLIVVCVGMILAAFIDGWALKVPNWVTLPLILSGWALGLLHDLGVQVDSGTGGFGFAVVGTAFGFILLFPMLAIGGVGVGDVKMQMGFGTWVAAYFGTGATTAAVGMNSINGLGVIFWAFAFGAIAGGVFGLVMIIMRRRFRENASMVGQIFTDLQLFAKGQTAQAAQRAHERRRVWVKLPYGIPLCVGFLLYLWSILVLLA